MGILLCIVGIVLSCGGGIPAISAAGEPQSAPVVILDAGHGGEDSGTVAPDGTKESAINLQVTQRLDSLLTFLGCRTVLTRTGEGSVADPAAKTLREKKRSDLHNRVKQINGIPGAVLISIHQNSLPQHPLVHGAQIFYNRVSGGEELAHCVQEELNRTAEQGNEKQCRAIAPDIYLMKEAACPAVLVECGFLSNRKETARLQDDKYQKQLAAMIAAGYLKYHMNEERL